MKQLSGPEAGHERVLIVDDHRLFAEAISSTLVAAGMEVVGVTSAEDETLQTVQQQRPHLVLLDLGLPGIPGMDLGRRIQETTPEVKIVVLTAQSDPGTAKRALSAGFQGFITKDTPMTRFVKAVRAAMEGDVVIPQDLARKATGFRTPDERYIALRVEQLTTRERDVLALLVEGASTEEIAKRLTVSPNTVRTHVQNILTKLGVRSRLQAAAFAVRHGVVDFKSSG